MKLGLALGILATTPAAGCSAAAPLVTVDKLLGQCDAYLGKQVQLAGYLGDCSGYDCHVAVDQSRWNAFVAAFNRTRGQRTAQEQAEAWSRVDALWPVGVGGGAAFDKKAAPLQRSYVVIAGRIDDHSCDGRGGTDRSPGIHPTDIRPWTRSEGAPTDAR